MYLPACAVSLCVTENCRKATAVRGGQRAVVVCTCMYIPILYCTSLYILGTYIYLPIYIHR